MVLVADVRRLVRRLSGGARMRHPGAVATAFIGAFDAETVLVEPERDRAAAPYIDPVDDRHHRPAAEAGRHLADNRIKAAAFDR